MNNKLDNKNIISISLLVLAGIIVNPLTYIFISAIWCNFFGNSLVSKIFGGLFLYVCMWISAYKTELEFITKNKHESHEEKKDKDTWIYKFLFLYWLFRK